jgi:hypothetical protein
MKKEIEIDGIEYRLVPIRKEEKTMFLFILTMPNAGSWNGKWTGSGNFYAIVKKAVVRKKNLYPNCREGNFYYNFGDGWGANVEVKLVTPSEAKKAEKASKGFCGYGWMVDSLLTTGKIIC